MSYSNVNVFYKMLSKAKRNVVFFIVWWNISDTIYYELLKPEKCVHRSSSIKNENKYHRFGEKQFLDRGDFKLVESVSEIRKANSNYFRHTNCISYTEFSARSTSANSVLKKYKSRRSVFGKKGTARLRCTEGTFRVHNIYGDGNCMFRAVSYILWRNEDEHRYLRTMVVQHINDNWQDYAAFVMAEWNISNCQEYCDYMNMVGTFACELECTVATKLYYMNLSIYREIIERRELKRVFHNHVSSQYDTARLLFTGNSDSGHYDVLLPEL